MEKKNLKIRLPIAAAALASSIPVLMIAVSLKFFTSINDLPEYFAAAKLTLEGKASSIYKLPELFAAEHQLFPGMGTRVIGFFLPPGALPLLLPLGFMPASLAPFLWTFILLLSLVASLFVLGRVYEVSRMHLFVVALPTVALSGPAYEALRIGQVVPILLLSFSLALLCLKQESHNKAALGLSLFILKPQLLAPFVFYLLGARRYRLLVSFGVLVLIYSITALGFVGLQGYVDWAHLVANPANLVFMVPNLNPTVRGQLLRIPAVSGAATPVSLVVLVLVFAFLYVLGSRMRASKDWLSTGVMASMPLGLVSAWHCHVYDLLLLIPAILALIRSPLVERVPTVTRMASLGIMALFLIPVYVHIHYRYLLKGGMINAHFLALLAFALYTGTLLVRQAPNPGSH